jgi:hypothetical protein
MNHPHGAAETLSERMTAMSMIREKLYEKTTPTGKHVELFIQSNGDTTFGIAVDIDGKDHTWGQPQDLSEWHPKTRVFQKIPAEATLKVGTVLFAADGPEILARFAAKMAELEAARQTRAAAIEPTGYLFEVGCDRGNTYRVLFAEEDWDDGFEVNEAVTARLRTDLIKRHVTLDEFRQIGEETGAKAVEPNMGIYWGLEFDASGFARLLALATERERTAEASRAAETAAKQDKEAAAIATARQSGKSVEISRWSEECDDPAEECSVDIVSRVAHADGTVKIHRQHTY